jgi:predicted nucleic acid-binding protein
VVLVDTSVWVDHLRHSADSLTSLLENGEVLCHPFIIGELACGNLNNRREILSLLHELPTARMPEDHEVLHFIEQHKLHGQGIGYIDISLLTSCRLSGAPLWTIDKKLNSAAKTLRLAHS